MSYEEFLDYVKEHLKNYLPIVHQVDSTEIQVVPVTKNNNTNQYAVVIKFGNVNGALPMLYLDTYYQQYKESQNIDFIMHSIAAKYMYSLEQVPEFDFKQLMDYEAVKDYIIVALVNTESNREQLKTIPHQDIGGLSAIYKIDITHSHFGPDMDGYDATVTIKSEMLEKFEITEEELHQVALQNSQRIYPPMLKGLKAIVQDPEKDDRIYVLTNTQIWQGAAVILYPGVMEHVQSCLGDVYIIPSSVHELLLVPKSEFSIEDADTLREILCEVNQIAVEPQEVLGTEIYTYNSELKQLQVIEPKQTQIKNKPRSL